MSRNTPPESFEGVSRSVSSNHLQKRKRDVFDDRTVKSPSGGLTNGVASPHDPAAPSSTSATSKRQCTSPPPHGDRLEGDRYKPPLNTEATELPNGVGSASSLTSTASSIFSNGSGQAHLLGHKNGGTGSHNLTPLTNHDSSPPVHSSSAFSRTTNADGKHMLSPHASHSHDGADIAPTSSTAMTPDATPPQKRTEARPPAGEAKGIKVVYDPEFDPKVLAKDKRKVRARYRKFGEEETSAPPDPRLAIPGYRSGELNVRLKGEAKIWKYRLRHAPYVLAPYPWDPAVSIGSGPPSAIVVTGFDPFTSESQLRAFFSTYGDIISLDNRTDPNTGSFLGVCFIRYGDQRNKRSVPAADAAKRAERDGSGQRVGLKAVKVERDRVGRKCQKIVDILTHRNAEKRAQDLERQNKQREAKPSPLHVPPASEEIQEGPLTAAATPPANAPKGPSGKPPARLPDGPRAALPPHPSSLIESEPILSKIKRKPYIYIGKEHVPVMGTTIPHLKKRLKMYDWREVRLDSTGYYIIFEDSRRGEEESARCFQSANGLALFTYSMVMECQQYGNPNYERSPTPERVIAEKMEKLERERIQQEEEIDFEVEKRDRAKHLDPAKAAFDILRDELKEKVMGDIKTRIAVPALYDLLEPSRHAEKRQKMGIPDPNEKHQAPTLLPIGNDSPSLRTPDRHMGATGAFRRRHANWASERATGISVFADERRQRRPKRRAEIMPLHHRLHNFYDAGGESDDEEKPSSRDDAKEQDSRSLSRMSSVAPSADREHEATPRKKRRIEQEPTPREEESGDDDFGIARSVLDPHVLKKEPEDMAMQELQLIVSSLPFTSKLHKHAKKEIGIRHRNRDDDQLFHIKTEEQEEPKVEDAGIVRDPTAPEISISAEETPFAKPAKKPAKSKKKSKKQVFEEREAAKAEAKSSKALLQAEEAPIPDTSIAEEAEPERGADEEETRAEVEWGVSTDVPRRTVEDELDLVFDIDGWQHLMKDEEDYIFLKRALQTEQMADLADCNFWASRQKEIKSLNGEAGLSFDDDRIKGYYVPNLTGSARTEGVKKIMQTEKSKYLPHHIKVKKAREQRAAEAKGSTLASAEEARKAKLASTAHSRSNRANNRTQVKDLNTVKQNLNVDGQQGDAIRFNQLKKRKKLVRFDRSAIHGWGLYAEENIGTSEMIIEYVGEKVRQAVANIREMKYDKQGMGSSYLFRIDEDTIVDATKKGGIARFINHSCAPNCTAKIIKVDGTKRIVIYALKDIAKNEELTYDYKFERELGNENRVICLCGSDTCKGFLN